MKQLALLALLVAPGAQADDLGVTGELSGYFETRHAGIFGLDTDLETKLKGVPLIDFDELGIHPSEQYGAINRLRPTLKLHLGEKATAVATVDGHSFHAFYGRSQDSIGDVVSVERLYLTFTDRSLDVTAGKMLFPGGHGLLLNPTDLFVERPPDDIRAELPGVWALRALYGFGESSSVTLIAATREEECCRPFVIGRYDLAIDETDGAATVAWDEGGDRVVFGLDVKSELEVGYWLESTFTLADLHEDDIRWYFDVEAGLDYTFEVQSGLYLALEYLHRGEGLAGDYTSTLLGAAVTRRPNFLGKDYAALLVRWMLSSDWQLQVLNVLNVRDPSGMVVPQLTWLPMGALELTLGGSVTYGEEGGEYTMVIPESAPLPDVRGDRLVPLAQVFLWGRYYF